MKNIFLSSLLLAFSSTLFAQVSLIKEIDTDKRNVLCMEISPDGKWIAAGADDNQVNFRDSESGDLLFSLRGHNDWVTAITFSAFENDMQHYFVSGSKDGWMIVYDIDKRNIIFQNKSHEKTINDLEIMSSLNYVASVSSDGFLSIIDLNTKHQNKLIKVSEQPVLSLKAIPMSNNIATTDAEGKIKIWDALTGNLVKVIDAHTSYARSVEIVGDLMISGSDDKDLKYWDLENNNPKGEIAKAHKKWVQIIKSAKDDKHFVSGGHDGLVQIWKTDMPEPIASVKQEGSFVSGIGFSTDLKKMYTSGYGGKTKIWDISSLNLEPVEVYKSQSKSVASSIIKGERSDVNEVMLVQPYIQKGDTYYQLEDKITLRGKILSKKSVKEFKIINSTTNEIDRLRLDENSTFEHEMALRFKNNEIEIRFTDVDGEVFNKKINIHRIFDQNSTDEMINLTRNGRDFALIIATNEYSEMNDLTNPVFDATTVAAELEANYGFIVEKVINPPLDEIKIKIKEYSKKMYADEDQLFIFIAGHGEYDELFKEGYLVATNSKASDEARSSYLPHSTLRTYINNIPCKHIFLTMDVCFGGTFDPFTAHRGSQAEKDEQVQKMLFIKRKLSYKTRVYITSGGKEYVPDGRPGHHSPFARKYIEALRTYGGGNGILSYKEIMGNVETVVPEPRAGEFGDNEPGSDFLFIYK